MKDHRKVKDHDVWVSVHKCYAFDDQNHRYMELPGYCCAFSIDKEVGGFIGEYVRDGNRASLFETAEEATNAAFAKAEEKLG